MKAFIIVAISFLVIVLILIVAVALAPVGTGCPPNSEPDTSGSGGYYSCICKDGFEPLNGRCVTPPPPPPPPPPPTPPPPPAGPPSFDKLYMDWEAQCVSCFASTKGVGVRVPDEQCQVQKVEQCSQRFDKLCNVYPSECEQLSVPTCVGHDYSQCPKGWPRYCDDRSNNVCWGDCTFNWDCNPGEYCTGSFWKKLRKKGRCAQKASKNR